MKRGLFHKIKIASWALLAGPGVSPHLAACSPLAAQRLVLFRGGKPAKGISSLLTFANKEGGGQRTPRGSPGGPGGKAGQSVPLKTMRGVRKGTAGVQSLGCSRELWKWSQSGSWSPKAESPCCHIQAQGVRGELN